MSTVGDVVGQIHEALLGNVVQADGIAIIFAVVLGLNIFADRLRQQERIWHAGVNGK